MATWEVLRDGVISKTSPYISLELPLAPIRPISTFVTHLISSPVASAIFPVTRLGALHAARVAIVWAGMTKAKRMARSKKVGIMGDLFGYLTLCWGGGTIVPMLLGQPPAWLLSSTPWQTYIPIYLLLVPTTLGEYVHSTCPTILYSIAGAFVDAITRGTTVCAIPAALAAARIPVTAWTIAVLGGIATTFGGILVQLLGLHEADWRLGTPSILNGGILNTLDFWGGMLASLLYASLLRSTPSLNAISNRLFYLIPSEYLHQVSPMTYPNGGEMMSREHARGMVVLFLLALFMARLVTLLVLAPGRALGKAKKMDKVDKEIIEAVDHEKVEDGILTREGQVTTRARSRAGTPKKSPKAKSH